MADLTPRAPDGQRWVESLGRLGMRLGLERMESLLAALGRPDKAIGSIIHVGGTNGKGSVAAAADEILRSLGRRTARFTSPHTGSFTRAMTIDGLPPSIERLAPLISRLKTASRRIEGELGEPPTQYEVLTALMYLLCAAEGVEVLIQEVGLGGRLDATNAAASIAASVITNVSLDHTAVLGDTIASIAREKAGIVRRSTPVITGAEGRALDIIAAAAAEKDAPLYPLAAPPAGGARAPRPTTDGAGSPRPMTDDAADPRPMTDGAGIPRSPMDDVHGPGAGAAGEQKTHIPGAPAASPAPWPPGASGSSASPEPLAAPWPPAPWLITSTHGDIRGTRFRLVESREGPAPPAAMELETPLIGAHQAFNASLAVLAVAAALGRHPRDLPRDRVEAGLAAVRWPGRLELFSRDPLIILDAGHNPAAMRALRTALDGLFPGRPLVLFWGMVKDKDIPACVDVWAGGASDAGRPPRRGRHGRGSPPGMELKAVVTAAPASARAAPAEYQARLFRHRLPEKVVVRAGSTRRKGLEAALQLQQSLGSDAVLCICGSTFLAEPAVELLRNEHKF